MQLSLMLVDVVRREYLGSGKNVEHRQETINVQARSNEWTDFCYFL